MSQLNFSETCLRNVGAMSCQLDLVESYLEFILSPALVFIVFNFYLFLQNSNPASDITSVYYSVLGLKLLGEAAPNKGELCAAAAKLADDSSVENLQAASGAAAALGCPIKFGAKVKHFSHIHICNY
jgi:hypothetical protein